MNEETQLKLQAWVDGELGEAEANRVAELAAEDLEVGQLVAELREVKSAIAGCDLARSVPETREFYWAKIARQIEAESKPQRVVRPGLMTRWRQFMMPLAGLTTLACIALFTLTPVKPIVAAGAEDEINATDAATEATIFHDQSSELTVVWLQDKDTGGASGASSEPAGGATVTQ